LLSSSFSFLHMDQITIKTLKKNVVL
jgi:hypothetical protein